MLSVESMLSKNFKTIGPETIGRPKMNRELIVRHVR